MKLLTIIISLIMVDLPWLFPIKRSESDIRKITMGNNLERKYMITRRTDSIKSKMFNKYQWLSRAATFEVSSEGYWSSYSQPKKLLSGSSYSNDIYDFGFHTRSKDFDQKPDKAPYIIIDLKKQAHVRGVLVHNRQNLQYRANGLTVWISKNKENWVEVGKAAEVHSEWGVETDGKGRYVKLGFTDKRSEAFHLRSVWIFGSFLVETFEGEWLSTGNDDKASIKIEKGKIEGKKIVQIGSDKGFYTFFDRRKNIIAKVRFLADNYLQIVTGEKHG